LLTFKILYSYKIVGKENLQKAAKEGFVVITETHSSFVGSFLMGASVYSILSDLPYGIIGERLKKDPFAYFFVKQLRAIYVDENQRDNRRALQEMENVIVEKRSKSLIIAPQGDLVPFNPDLIKFKQGFAIPVLNAVKKGASVYIVPAITPGTPYACTWPQVFQLWSKFILPGKSRIHNVFGEPIKVMPGINRRELTQIVEDAVKDLMRKHV
jgi:1-acyl-sn-glycerol-3-phosphate acyltransferase